jgi:two-component system, OmpR family, response regulator MprA
MVRADAAIKNMKKVFRCDAEASRTSRRTLRCGRDHGAMTDRVRILIVDDEPNLRRSLKRVLEREDYAVLLAEGGFDALHTLGRTAVDAIVLDVALPDVDGAEVARRIRGRGDRTPILMLTARDAIDDRVAGLEAGADDYVVKPFALAELHARLRALLRRAEPATGELRFGDLRMEASTRRLWRGDRRIELSRTESALMELFMRSPGKILSRSTIFEQVWGYDFGPTSNTLGVYVGYLRRKLELGGGSRVVHTVRGVGYILREESL